MAWDYHLDATIDRHEEPCPRQRLWQEVILNAMVEAQYQGTNKEHLTPKWQAEAWLRGESRDFKEVCALAGWDADAVREAWAKGIKMRRTYQRKIA